MISINVIKNNLFFLSFKYNDCNRCININETSKKFPNLEKEVIIPIVINRIKILT